MASRWKQLLGAFLMIMGMVLSVTGTSLVYKPDIAYAKSYSNQYWKPTNFTRTKSSKQGQIRTKVINGKKVRQSRERTVVKHYRRYDLYRSAGPRGVKRIRSEWRVTSIESGIWSPWKKAK